MSSLSPSKLESYAFSGPCEVCGSREHVSQLRTLPEGRNEGDHYVVALCLDCLTNAGTQSLFRILTHPK